jgi:hypothetical protein
MKAVQAADELRFEPVDSTPDVDQVRAQSVGRDIVDGLVDESFHGVMQTVSRIRYCERFH